MEQSQSGEEESEVEFYDVELVDELAKSRREFKLRSKSFSDDNPARVRNTWRSSHLPHFLLHIYISRNVVLHKIAICLECLLW